MKEIESARWGAGQGLVQDLTQELMYAGSVRVRIPAECAQDDSRFVAVPSKTSVDGFVLFDIDPEDIRECPGDSAIVLWDICRDKEYRAMRTSRLGGPAPDEACFAGSDVLNVYLQAAKSPDPEALLAWAFEASAGRDSSPASVSDSYTPLDDHAFVWAPEGLILPGASDTGFGIIFPDPKAMGGIGLIGSPDVAYRDGILDLGGWCSPVWRLVSNTLESMPACFVLRDLRSILDIWGKAGQAKQDRFLFLKPEKLPPWPEFHGKDVFLRSVPASCVLKSDLPGVYQIELDGRDGAVYILAPGHSVRKTGYSRLVFLGRSDMPVPRRGASGNLSIIKAGSLDGFAFQSASGSDFDTVRLRGISRVDTEIDHAAGTCDISFMGADGFLYGIKLDSGLISEGGDGLLEADLGFADAPVRLYRRMDDGMCEGVPAVAGDIFKYIARGPG